MSIRTFTRAFNGGEVSPSMFGRIDDGKYQTGLALCRNFLIEPQGPIMKRPGFAYVNRAKSDSSPSRLIPFTFSSTQSLVLEFADRCVRFHTQGMTVMNGDVPYEVKTDYTADELFDIHYVQSADVVTLVHPNHPPMELRRYGATDWRLEKIVFMSTLSPPGAPSVTQHINDKVTNPTDYTRTYAVTSLDAEGKNESVISAETSVACNPYGDGAYNTITWSAVARAGMYRVYRKEGGLWAYIGQTTTTSIVDENLTADASITPPLYGETFQTKGAIASVSVTDQGGGYGQRKQVTGFERKAARKLKTEDDAPWTEMTFPFTVGEGTRRKLNGVELPVSGDGEGAKAKATFSEGRITGFEITSPGHGYTFASLEFDTYLGDDPIASILGFRYKINLTVSPAKPTIAIRDNTGSGAELDPTVSDDGRVIGIRVVKGGQNYSAPVLVIDGRESGGSGAAAVASVGTGTDNPCAVSYFEQRRWFGGTPLKPSNIWATKSGTESDMAYSLPAQDDDRISVRVAARDANRILHIVPLSRLMLLTSSTEWGVTSLNSDALTATSFSVRPQAYVGASNVQPLVINNQMLYGAARGGHIQECGYDYQAGGYVTRDACLRAPHLFDNREIVDLAYAKAPWPLVWAVSSDGRLIAFTYVPEQQVGAFSTVETLGRIESCCVVAEGLEDVLYISVDRTINGVQRRFIERMHERQFTTLEESAFLDCSGTYRGAETTTVSGLSWLEGMEVSILADGSVEPTQVVKNGTITLETPAKVIHIGLPYGADAKTLPVALQLQDGSFGAGHQKNVVKCWFRVVDSGGLKAGPSFDRLVEYPARKTEYAGSPPDALNDEFGLSIPAKWSASGQVCIRQDNPLPMRVTNVTMSIEVS